MSLWVLWVTGRIVEVSVSAAASVVPASAALGIAPTASSTATVLVLSGRGRDGLVDLFLGVGEIVLPSNHGKEGPVELLVEDLRVLVEEMLVHEFLCLELLVAASALVNVGLDHERLLLDVFLFDMFEAGVFER